MRNAGSGSTACCVVYNASRACGTSAPVHSRTPRPSLAAGCESAARNSQQHLLVAVRFGGGRGGGTAHAHRQPQRPPRRQSTPHLVALSKPRCSFLIHHAACAPGPLHGRLGARPPTCRPRQAWGRPVRNPTSRAITDQRCKKAMHSSRRWSGATAGSSGGSTLFRFPAPPPACRWLQLTSTR